MLQQIDDEECPITQRQPCDCTDCVWKQITESAMTRLEERDEEIRELKVKNQALLCRALEAERNERRQYGNYRGGLPMATAEDIQDIRTELDKIRQVLALHSDRIAALSRPREIMASHKPIAAADSDIDGKYGNPEVRFEPKRWNGTPQKGLHYSECEPDFLDMLAETLEFFAKRNDEQGAVDKNGNPKSNWDRRDAARARGWAARKRGQLAPAPSPVQAQHTTRMAQVPQAYQAGFGDNDGGEAYDDQIPF